MEWRDSSSVKTFMLDFLGRFKYVGKESFLRRGTGMAAAALAISASVLNPPVEPDDRCLIVMLVRETVDCGGFNRRVAQKESERYNRYTFFRGQCFSFLQKAFCNIGRRLLDDKKKEYFQACGLPVPSGTHDAVGFQSGTRHNLQRPFCRMVHCVDWDKQKSYFLSKRQICFILIGCVLPRNVSKSIDPPIK